MGKRGQKPQCKVMIRWSSDFAYPIGLLTTDGSLSKDGRHVCFTSKDIELIENFKNALNVKCNVGLKSSGSSKEKKYFNIQIGDVEFEKFLLSIGLMPNKTKILKDIKIFDKYFVDFLRGHFDGDGSFFSYIDPRSRSSLMFYMSFVSASKNHIEWLRKKVFDFVGIKGHITKGKNVSVYQLKFAKKESLILIKKLYYKKKLICLSRKRSKIEQIVELNKKINHARVVKPGKHASLRCWCRKAWRFNSSPAH